MFSSATIRIRSTEQARVFCLCLRENFLLGQKCGLETRIMPLYLERRVRSFIASKVWRTRKSGKAEKRRQFEGTA